MATITTAQNTTSTLVQEVLDRLDSVASELQRLHEQQGVERNMLDVPHYHVAVIGGRYVLRNGDRGDRTMNLGTTERAAHRTLVHMVASARWALGL